MQMFHICWRKNIYQYYLHLPALWLFLYFSGLSGLAGKSLGISSLSHKLCSTFSSSLRQNNSTRSISFPCIYISQYSLPKHDTWLLTQCQEPGCPPSSCFSVKILLAWQNLISENIRLLSIFKPSSQVTHHCYRLLFNYNYYFNLYKWL